MIKEIAKLYKARKRNKKFWVVQLGDLFDCISWSKWAKLFKILPEDELIQARECAKEMWEEIKRVAPQAICIQLMGNHDDRPIKRLMEKCPELEPFINLKDWFLFDGVKTIFDSREGYEIDGILFIHGFLSKLGAHALYFNKRVVRGHSHRAGVVFYNNCRDERNRIWEAESGYLGSTDALPFRYGPSKFTQWQRGITVIENGFPCFIPL